MSPLCMLGMCGWIGEASLVCIAHTHSPNPDPILRLEELSVFSTHLLPGGASIDNAAGQKCCPLPQMPVLTARPGRTSVASELGVETGAALGKNAIETHR